MITEGGKSLSDNKNFKEIRTEGGNTVFLKPVKAILLKLFY